MTFVKINLNSIRMYENDEKKDLDICGKMILDSNSFFLAFLILILIFIVLIGIFYLVGKKFRKLKYLWVIVLILFLSWLLFVLIKPLF